MSKTGKKEHTKVSMLAQGLEQTSGVSVVCWKNMGKHGHHLYKVRAMAKF